jgi:hypothetical protein
MDSVASLVMEVLGPAAKSGFVRRMISEHGFQAYYINDFDLEHSLDGSFVYSAPQYNWLFCRHAPTVLRRLLAGTRFRVMPSEGYRQ